MQNAIVQAMLSSLGSMLRSFGYDDKYLGGILEGMAKDVHDISQFVEAVARENSERLARIERKLDTLMPFPIVDAEPVRESENGENSERIAQITFNG